RFRTGNAVSPPDGVRGAGVNTCQRGRCNAMSSPLEALASQAEWAAKDFAHNLDFIPADKLAWKPAPTAKSALDIANESVGFAKGMLPMLSGGSFTPPNFTPATTAPAAKELLISTGKEYAQAL